MSLRLTFRSGERGGDTIEVAGESFEIGRDPACDLVLADEKVSRVHARLTQRPGKDPLLTDLGSSNGTFVDGERLEGTRQLRGGEEIRFGATSLELAVLPGASVTGTTPVGTPAPPAGTPGSPAPSTPPRRPGQSTLIRALEGRMRRTTLIALTAVVIALALGGVALSGVLAGNDKGDGGGGATRPTTQEIVRAVKPSTVLIETELDGEATGLGSGWVLDAAGGLVVTNAHVVNLQPDAGSSEFEIVANGLRRPAELVGMAPCEDLALLRVSDSEGLRSLPLGSQGDLEQGETVVAVGFPETASSTPNLVATQGVVSVVESRADAASGTGVVKLPNVVQTDAAINSGNSGGPLVDLRKRLVGVNTLTKGDAENQGYAIGVDQVKEVLQTLRGGESIAWTGAAFTPLADAASGEGQGLLLAATVPGTAAQDAGLGDDLQLLLAVNGQRIEPNVAGYCEAIGSASSGEQVTLTVRDVSRTPSGAYVLERGAPEDLRLPLE